MSDEQPKPEETVKKGMIYVLKDHVDTDVIIPARYLNSMDPVYLGVHAMEDLDPREYPIKFIGEGGRSNYKIIVAGDNFGCGSSREHAPIALRAAGNKEEGVDLKRRQQGVEIVVAHSLARIFYRNCVNGGLILPLQSEVYMPDLVNTGDSIEVILRNNGTGVVIADGKEFGLKPFGPVKEIIDAGGLTAYNKTRLGL